MLLKNKKTKTKYLFVTGGVLSGVGKGTITSSIGKVLQAQGYNINVIKIDPYLNVDAGTMRPTEHGEVFVTYDGGETDQDLGNYERFLDKEFSKINSITSGQVYLSVINRERNLDYHGECVSVIPHVPDEIKRRIRESSKIHDADFTLIEVGGTTGDYENILFLEALRELKLEREECVFVHVVFLPVPNNIGEMKTKPAQHSIRELNSLGIQADFIVARSKISMDNVRRKKLANYANLNEEFVISAPDFASIYDIPLYFEEEKFTENILKKFNIKCKQNTLKSWKITVDKIKGLEKKVCIGIIGKYFDTGKFTLSDSYISVIEAVKHACYQEGVIPDISWIDSKKYESEPDKINELSFYDGVIIPGGFGSSGVEGKISAIQFCRTQNIPFLGICYGLQLAVVEFARHVCGLEDAHSTEFKDNPKNPIIDILPEQKKLLEEKKYGASMRLGNYEAKLDKNSLVAELYNTTKATERHRHRFEVNPKYHDCLKKAGLTISGTSKKGTLVEYIELPNHPYFVGTQAHPEFTSRFSKGNPLFVGLVKEAKKKNMIE